jgi:hypothetical protein
MRAKEFIPEGKNRKSLRKGVAQSMNNLTTYDQLDNNNNPYLAYRFGIALAGSPTEDMDKKGAIGSDFVMADYTDADTMIRKGAERVMGISSTTSSGKGSKELDGKIINKNSVVSTPKRNRYGV